MTQTTLTFQPQMVDGKQRYVCEETVTADYALHIERTGAGKLNFFVRSTADGKYCPSDVSSFLQNLAKEVFDYDFTHLVYPKYIRIESDTEVTSATLITAE